MQLPSFISEFISQSPLPRLALLCLALVGLSLIFRMLFGPGSAVNHAICCAMGIGMVYALSAVIYVFRPQFLSSILSPLPFLTFQEDRLVFFSFLTSPFRESCGQILSMVILAFLVCLTDSIMPQGNRIRGWIFTRFVNVLLAMGAHHLVLLLLDSFPAGLIQAWAPMILLMLLLGMLLLGLLKVLLGVVLTIINPLIGAVYAFFFSSLIGKQVTKAVFATVILLILMVVLEKAGFHTLAIDVSALRSYIPTAAMLGLIWFLIGHKL